ncbi:hypothetical protein PIROE2DRAFT_6309, partial [Piromyces sp. E2]
YSLDLPSIDPITLSLDEIFTTQDINFDSMFSNLNFNLSSDNNISDSLLKETKINDIGKDSNISSKLDYSDNTLYSETESSNEQINSSEKNIKKQTTSKDVKPKDVKDNLLDNKNNKVSTIKKDEIPKVEPPKEQVKVEPKVEKLKIENEKKPIEKKVDSKDTKSEGKYEQKEKEQTKDKKLEKPLSIEKEPSTTVNDVQVNDIQNNNKQEKDIQVNNIPITDVQENDIKNNDDIQDKDININDDVQVNNDSLIQDKVIDNENNEKPLDDHKKESEEEEEDKHSNMVLKEKLYEEQKNQNKIGLIKNVEMLNLTSSFKKTKTKQKAVQFKSSWSGELENTRRMSKDHSNYISTTKGNFLIKLNKMDIKSTCPVFFSGNFETDSMYTMFCEFKCDDEVYFTSKQYPIHSNNPQISLNEDINIPITADQNILEINVMLIKKAPVLMQPQTSSKSGKHSNSSGMSTLTRTMTHSKKAVQNLMFWKKNKNIDGFNSVNSNHMHMNSNMMNFDENSLKKNDLQFRSLSSTSSISKLFTNDGGSSIQSNHKGRNYHPSVKTIFNNNNTGTPSPSNGLSRESTCDCISGSNSSLNSSYSVHSTYSTFSTNTITSSSSSTDNVFVAGKITVDLQNLRDQHMGELIEDFKWDITPPKPLKNNSIDSGNILMEIDIIEINIIEIDIIEIDIIEIDIIEIDILEIDIIEIDIIEIDIIEIDITEIDILEIDILEIDIIEIDVIEIDKVMQWDGLDAPLVILNGKLNMSIFYLPYFSYKEDIFIPKTIADCLDCQECKCWHDTETKTGFLTQKGGDVNDWERRFYRLIGEKLIAFDSSSSGGSIATIDLTQCKFINLLLPDPQNSQFINNTLPNGEEYTTIVALNPSTAANDNYIFELVFKDDDAIEFKCDSLDDMNGWCKELQIVVQEWEDFQYPNWWTELSNFKEELENGKLTQ